MASMTEPHGRTRRGYFDTTGPDRRMVLGPAYLESMVVTRHQARSILPPGEMVRTKVPRCRVLASHG